MAGTGTVGRPGEEPPAFDVRLDRALEGRVVAVLREAEAEKRLHRPAACVRRDAAKLNALWVALAKLGFQQADIQACLTLPDCNSLQVALDWLCLHVDPDRIPAEVRGSPPPAPEPEADGGGAGQLTFVSNEARRRVEEPAVPEPLSPAADPPPGPPSPTAGAGEPDGREAPAAPDRSATPSPETTPAAPDMCAEGAERESQKAWIQRFMEQEEEGEEEAAEGLPSVSGNRNRDLNAALLWDARALEERYRAALDRAGAVKDQDPAGLAALVKELKQMETEAKRITQQYTGKPALQLCPLFRANRTEVERLGQATGAPAQAPGGGGG
eukprot:EG_transcript_18281